MKRLTTRTVFPLALLLVGGCATDPTDDLRNGVDHLLAEPSQLFVDPGQIKRVEVGAVDAQGNSIEETFVVTQVGPGISVTRDSSFRTVFVNDSQQAVPERAPRFRFIVTAAPFDPSTNNFPASSFVVTAAGKSITIPVQVAPIGTLDVTFSTTAPAIGESVTMTAPPGITFTDTATVTFVGAPLQPVILAQDATSITFLLPPNAGGPLKVSGVLSPSAPGVVLEPLTTIAVTSPKADTVDVVFSTVTPAIGGTVNVTISNPLLKFKPCTLPGVPGCVVPPSPGDTSFAPQLTFDNQVASPEAVTVSADSNTLSFEAPPNAAGPGKIDSIIFPGGYALSLPSRTTVTVPSIGTTVAVTFSNNTPGLGDTVIATAPANFRFTQATSPIFPGTTTPDPFGFREFPILTLAFGTKLGSIQSISPDSTKVAFVPIQGTAGPAIISGLRYTPAPQFSVTLPTVQTVTVPTVTPLLGTDDPKTAPTLALPAPGGTTTLFDAGPFLFLQTVTVFGTPFVDPHRLYKVVLPSPATLTFTVEWYEGQIMFFSILTDPNTVDVDVSNTYSDLDEASPETATVSLPAGTFYLMLAMDDLLPQPNMWKITVDRAP
jgi:hypothetical protein